MTEETNNIQNDILEDNRPSAENVISQAEYDALKKERDEYLDGWKRAKADLINFKNEEMNRLKEISRFATEDMLRDLIIVLDSFDLALSALSKELDSATGKGVYMIRTQLEDVLKKKGLERISSPIGNVFDPALHEAIASLESEKEVNIVIDEVEKGYMLQGRVIRPARVVVSKGKVDEVKEV